MTRPGRSHEPGSYREQGADWVTPRTKAPRPPDQGNDHLRYRTGAGKSLVLGDDRSGLAGHRMQISPLCMETAVRCLRPTAAQGGGFASPSVDAHEAGLPVPDTVIGAESGHGMWAGAGVWPLLWLGVAVGGSRAGSTGRSSCLRSGASGAKLCPSAGGSHDRDGALDARSCSVPGATKL